MSFLNPFATLTQIPEEESKVPERAVFSEARNHADSLVKFGETKDLRVLTCIIRGVNAGANPPQHANRSLTFAKHAQKGAKSKGKGKGKTAEATGARPPSVLRIAEFAKLWNQQGSIQPFLKNPYLQNNRPYYIAETVPPFTLLTTGAVATTSGYAFSVTNIPQATSLSSVFDQYRVIRIEAWIQYAPATTGIIMSNLISPTFITAVDYDDSTSPATFAALYDNENALTSQLEEGHYHDFTPKVASAVYNGAFTGFASVQAPWIDAASLTVEHYGIKIACEAAVANPIRMTYRLHTEWRALH
jgi:hypothetical protein